MFFKLLFFITLLAISILAVLPDYNALPPVVSMSDVINHILAFFTLSFLFKLAYPKLKTILHVFLLSAYGVAIEVVQYFLPTRFGDPYDVLSDILGVLLALIFML
ncbi:MAG: VanZ family protein [Campylobacterota bacterium]|nr:VanZ family protein [Campylobacterota bacterium]